jgi:hypothetical protein
LKCTNSRELARTCTSPAGYGYERPGRIEAGNLAGIGAVNKIALCTYGPCPPYDAQALAYRAIAPQDHHGIERDRAHAALRVGPDDQPLRCLRLSLSGQSNTEQQGRSKEN